LVSKASATAISEFGIAVKSKLTNAAISGAPEDQLRGPLENLVARLSEIEKWVSGKVELVGETSLAHLQVRPDYAVSIDNALVGFIEVKAPGKGLDPRKFSDPHDKAQWAKLKSLPNLLYTDGSGFSLWRNGELEGKPVFFDGDIETAGAKLQAPSSLGPLLSDFLTWIPQPPPNASKLAEVSARLCRLLRDEVMEQMEEEQPSLLALREDWKKLLFPNASNEQFADGYAQAVTFGLLMARALDVSLKEGVEIAAFKLKRTNSLIGTALNLLTEDPAIQSALKTSLGTLLRVLNEVNWEQISKGKPEVWLNFYEDFLEVYDNRLRKLTGSYYTPPQVVEAMTRLVDEALRGPLFNRAQGLAAEDVTIADPAVGTGTFLLGVLDKIAQITRDDPARGEGMVPGAITAAAKRVFGFEIQFGPFAVAQLRILAEFRALTKSTATAPDLHLFITDTLGNPFVEDEHLLNVVEAVAKSRREANKVKRGQPITVVIGNPPYKEKAEGRGGWIEAGSDGRPAPLDRWKAPPEWGVGAHGKHLKNLYVYFWRWATLKVFGSGLHAATNLPEKDEEGIVCFITVAGFLNGPGFQAMRDDLRRTCSSIWVIDCSPEGHQPDVPTRIFQGVQHPVCVVLAARKHKKSFDKPALVKFRSLPEGNRKLKFEALSQIKLHDSGWVECAREWRASFLPKAHGLWGEFASLRSLFVYNGSGVMPGRTSIIAPDVGTLERRWQALISTKDVEKREALFYPHQNGDKTSTKPAKAGLTGYEFRMHSVASDKATVIPPVRYAFRTLDRQWIIPDNRLINRANPNLWKHYSAKQIYLTALHSAAPSSGPALTVSSLIPDLDHYRGSFGGRAYPLWSDAAASQPNFRPELLDLIG